MTTPLATNLDASGTCGSRRSLLTELAWRFIEKLLPAVSPQELEIRP